MASLSWLYPLLNKPVDEQVVFSFHHCISVIMSGEITFGATITGGIQDVAGLLPLLGTEQCEEHIGSALTGGYLYAAATPMSIFGSLGMARAGFKTLIACISGRTWSGATILANMGFKPKGTNFSLVMIDKDDKDGRHLAKTRLDELVKELHIDRSRVTVSHKCTRWNVTMIILTALLSSLSMIPYIHINLKGSKLTHFSQWTFPILRAVGGFLTASMMQIVIERRIARLTASQMTKFNKPETLDHAGESPGELPGNTSNAERPPAVDVAQGSQGEARSDAGSRRASHNSGTGEMSRKNWVSLTLPMPPVIGGRQRASLATQLLPNTIRRVSSMAHLIMSFSAYSSPASSHQWLATWAVLASCRMRNHRLGLSAGCVCKLRCRLSE
jgi:hypothetical protein